MPVTSLAPTSNTGGVHSGFDFGGTYAQARNGTGSKGLDSAQFVGQTFMADIESGNSFVCFESFFEFNPSAAGSGPFISARLDLWLKQDFSTTDFTVEACVDNFGTSITTADYVPGGSLLPSALAASLSTTGIALGTNSCVNSGTVLLDAVNAGGLLRLLFSSNRERTNTSPTGDEYIRLDAVSCRLVLDDGIGPSAVDVPGLVAPAERAGRIAPAVPVGLVGPRSVAYLYPSLALDPSLTLDPLLVTFTAGQIVASSSPTSLAVTVAPTERTALTAPTERAGLVAPISTGLWPSSGLFPSPLLYPSTERSYTFGVVSPSERAGLVTPAETAGSARPGAVRYLYPSTARYPSTTLVPLLVGA